MARLVGPVGPASAEPAYRWLAARLRALVLEGRLMPETKLPGERSLATALGVSRTTITHAFDLLREDGFVESRHGSGSVVNLPQSASVGPLGWLAGTAGEDVIDLSTAALPASSGVMAAYEAAMGELLPHLNGMGFYGAGLPALREAVARHYRAEGVETSADQILITQGALHSFHLVLDCLCGPGDRAIVDNPTYPPVLDRLRQARVEAVPVSLTGGGWDLEDIEAAIRQTAPRCAYVIADFHNPTGADMDTEMRGDLVALARATRTHLIADETMRGLRFGGAATPPLSAFDPDGTTVIALGSMGKGFWGGLRIGWVRADARLITRLGQRRATIDVASPVLEQLAATHLLGGADAGLEARCALARAQRDHLVALLEDRLPDWRVPAPDGGLSLWIELPGPWAAEMEREAERFGVRIVAGPRFGVAAAGGFHHFVRMTYARSMPDLDEGIDRLGKAWDALAARMGSGAGLSEAPPATILT